MPHSRIGIVHFSDALNTIRYSIFLGEEYLIQHAETLKYNVGKAQLAKKRKHQSHENIDATIDTVFEANNVTPIASCQTTVQPVNTEHVGEAGQSKGGVLTKRQDKEKVLEVPGACCQERSSKPVRKKGDSERDSEEEMMGQEHDAPVENKFEVLVEALKKLVRLFSLGK